MVILADYHLSCGADLCPKVSYCVAVRCAELKVPLLMMQCALCLQIRLTVQKV